MISLLAILTIWIFFNSSLVSASFAWDPFPFHELALVTVLVALFLTAIILISQNRAAELAERRADLDLQISLLSEHEITKILSLLDDMAHHMDIKSSTRQGLDEFKSAVPPETVLKEIEKAESKAPSE